MAAESKDFIAEINRLNGLLDGIDQIDEEKEKDKKDKPLASGWGYFMLNKQG